MSGKRWYLVIGITFAVACMLAMFWVLNSGSSYDQGDSDIFEISVGETVELSIHENSSTGYSNCWINEAECNQVNLLSTKSSSGIPGCIGCGSSVKYVFEGVVEGTDTVLIKNCPTLRMQKDCTYFSIDNWPTDSLMAQGYVADTIPDYIFIFKVTD